MKYAEAVSRKNPPAPRRNIGPKDAVESAVPSPRKQIKDLNVYSRGGVMNMNVQQTVDMLLENSAYKTAANAMLNPGHEGNVLAATALPDASPGDVYVHKSIVLGTISIPAGSAVTGFQIALVPLPECPMLIRFDNENWQAVADTAFVTSGGVINQAANFFHMAGVYSHRLIGKSVTLTNETPELYQSGNVTCCRMPGLLDNNSPSVVHDSALTATTNRRVLQTMPLNAAEVTTNTNAVNWHSKSGCYLVARPTLQWVDRVHPWDKSSSLLVNTSPAASVTTDTLRVSNFGAVLSDVGSGGLGYGTDGDYKPGTTLTYRFPTGAGDGSDVVVGLLDGLNTSAGQTFKFKLCIVREFRLKNNSMYVRQAVPRPIRSDLFIEKLMNYSAMMRGMYPADYNFFDKLWTGFKKMLHTVSDLLPGISAAITPVLPPEARAILGIANRVNDAGRNIFGGNL